MRASHFVHVPMFIVCGLVFHGPWAGAIHGGEIASPADELPGDTGEFASLPGTRNGACVAEERLRQLREDGANKTCVASIERSLRWLKEKQNEDGSWGVKFQASMTGLALLAYLGYCETPRSEEYGETVRKAITYLVNVGTAKAGRLATVDGFSWVYEHAIATWALCDAHLVLSDAKIEFPELKRTCAKAVRIILDGQHPGGAWDYDYNKTNRRPGDTSIVGWHMLALKAAFEAGFEPEEIQAKAVERAHNWLEQRQNEDGTFGYTTKGSGTGQRLVGVGALGFQIWGKGETRVARNSTAWLATEMTKKNSTMPGTTAISTHPISPPSFFPTVVRPSGFGGGRNGGNSSSTIRRKTAHGNRKETLAKARCRPVPPAPMPKSTVSASTR